MKRLPQQYPFYLYDVPNHVNLKAQILESIHSMEVRPLVDETQRITNTDWHLGCEYVRPYYSYLVELFKSHSRKIMDAAGISSALNPINYWFQQYKEGDYHGWHIHPDRLFANVYYLDLPDGSSKTSFKVEDNVFEVEVKEGQILTFPSCFLHCSKPNPTGVKTVISFNY